MMTAVKTSQIGRVITWGRKIAKSQRRTWKNPVTRRNRLTGIQRAWRGKAGEERRKKVSKSISKAMRRSEEFQRVMSSPEHRKRISKAHRQRLQDPKQVVKLVRNLKLSEPGRITKPQMSLFKRLCRAGIPGLKLEYPVGGFLLDIAHLPTKTVVESDGSYFHEKKKDRKRDKSLRKLGWKVIRFELDSKKEARCLDIEPLICLLERRD